MLLLTPLYNCPQNLGLAQIEAIVQEIEQEKEAGKSKRLSYVPTVSHSVVHCRGGKEAFEAGCHGSRTGGDGEPCRGRARIIMAVFCNYMHHVVLDNERSAFANQNGK